MKRIVPLTLVSLFSIIFLSCEKEPTASFTASSTDVEIGEVVEFTNHSTDADHYKWFFGEGSTSTDENPSFTYASTGKYNVTLIAYSKSGKQLDDAYILYVNVYPKTCLLLKVTVGGSPLAGCRVDVYGNQTDWASGKNRIGVATTGANGQVSFTGCQAKVYYVDFVYDNVIVYSGSTNVLRLYEDNLYEIDLVSKRLTFNNSTFLPIKITVDGTSQRTIEVGGSTTYSVCGDMVHLVAESQATFSNGSPLGLKVTWDSNISITTDTKEVDLNVASDICFFSVTNNSTKALGKFYFNYGNASLQTYFSCNIPADGKKYTLGYHYAFTGGQIRAYHSPEDGYYSYWTPTYANTINQSMNLLKNNKSELKFDSEPKLDLPESNFLLKPIVTDFRGSVNHSNAIQFESNGVK